MARITVARLTTNKPAEPIHEPLLTTQQAKVERGRNELDDKGTYKSILDVTMYPDAIFRPGDLVRVKLDNEEFVGRVLSISFSLARAEKSMQLSIERSIF